MRLNAMIYLKVLGKCHPFSNAFRDFIVDLLVLDKHMTRDIKWVAALVKLCAKVFSKELI